MDPVHGPLAPAEDPEAPLEPGQARTSPARFRHTQDLALQQEQHDQYDKATAEIDARAARKRTSVNHNPMSCFAKQANGPNDETEQPGANTSFIRLQSTKTALSPSTAPEAIQPDSHPGPHFAANKNHAHDPGLSHNTSGIILTD
ncbi:hypothetical protein [Granulicella arctica]|uniref:hypothetical protein n=1 Tax=Granulicella arctica TaxID=940613 RepID=UPI0021E03DD4|nr:hypothetical protein [Granulicella arctica]